MILSDREVEVLLLISKEYTTQDVAAELYISHHTVITHRKNLMSKHNARNVAGLITKAFQQGYLDIQR